MFILDVCGIPGEITNTIGMIYNILLIAIPVVVIIFGLIDFIKAVMSGKEDQIKSNTSVFLKRVITGFLAFFVLAIVKFGMQVIAKNVDGANEALSCMNSILGNTNSKNNKNGD